MRSTCKRMFTLALTGVLPGVLLASFALPADAQTAESRPTQTNRYKSAPEVTITGTVEQVITKHILGSPAGMHLLVSGNQGMVDVHVGPFMSKSTKEALHMGLPLQVVGAMETFHGKQYLLARQLIYGGQTVNVRNSNGLLLSSAQSSNAAKSVLIGGGR
jgi:hypothetical protein